eukprot:350205-Rhodomonas_salina.2
MPALGCIGTPPHRSCDLARTCCWPGTTHTHLLQRRDRSPRRTHSQRRWMWCGRREGRAGMRCSGRAQSQ